MEPGRSAFRSFLRRPSASSSVLLAVAPGLAALLLGAVGWRWSWFDQGALSTLLVILEGALANVALFAGFLALRDRLTQRAQQIALCEQQLRHLASWNTDEGVWRKVGLIRDLNTLGVAPRSLAHTMLGAADLTGCDLRGADLRGADLSHANLQGALLDGADLSDADCSEANLALASLPGVTARGASFEGAALTKVNLAGASLGRANLVNANLHGTDLRGVTLERARFAEPEAGPFGPALHPSVDDWIRERLDARGYFGGETPPSEAPARSRKARAG